MQLQELNPYIRYCKIHPQPVQYQNNVQAYDCRIFYVLNGTGQFYVADEQHDFCPCSLIYIPSGVEYRFVYEIRENVRFLILNFDILSDHCALTQSITPDDAAHFQAIRKVPVPPCPVYSSSFCIRNFEEGQEDLLSIHRLFVNEPPYYAEIASGILKKVLMQLVSLEHSKNESSSVRTADVVLAFVRQNYAKPITNQMISEHFSFHPYYLNRLIKAATGQSLHSYLIQYRIREAQTLLATSSSPVHHIAANVGFGTASQFSAAFKKTTGLSPTKYRNLHNSYI